MTTITIPDNNPNSIFIVILVLAATYLIFGLIRIFAKLRRKKKLEKMLNQIKELKKDGK